MEGGQLPQVLGVSILQLTVNSVKLMREDSAFPGRQWRALYSHAPRLPAAAREHPPLPVSWDGPVCQALRRSRYTGHGGHVFTRVCVRTCVCGLPCGCHPKLSRPTALRVSRGARSQELGWSRGSLGRFMEQRSQGRKEERQ